MKADYEENTRLRNIFLDKQSKRRNRRRNKRLLKGKIRMKIIRGLRNEQNRRKWEVNSSEQGRLGQLKWIKGNHAR